MNKLEENQNKDYMDKKVFKFHKMSNINKQ